MEKSRVEEFKTIPYFYIHTLVKYIYLERKKIKGKIMIIIKSYLCLQMHELRSDPDFQPNTQI